MKPCLLTIPSLLLGLAVALASGCATARKPDYHSTGFAPTARTVQHDGVEVGLDPFVERDRTRQYFGINALDDGIAILHVVVSNRSQDQTFLVEKRNFQLFRAGALAADGAEEGKIDRSTVAGEAVAITGAALGSLPMLFAGAALLSQSTEIRRNFVSKELPDQTLPPGQSVEGFIYYKPVAKNVDWSRGSNIRVLLPKIRSGRTTEVDIHLPE